MVDDAFDRAAQRWADGQRTYAKFVARYWADERFRETVRRDPATALARAGIEMPEGLRPKVVEIDEDETLVVIPRTTGSLEASELGKSTLGSIGCVTATNGTWGTLGGTSFSFGYCRACMATQPSTEGPQLPEPESGDGDTSDGGDGGQLKGPQPR